MTDGRVHNSTAYQANVTMCLHYTLLNKLIFAIRIQTAIDARRKKPARTLKLTAGFVYTPRLLAYGGFGVPNEPRQRRRGAARRATRDVVAFQINHELTGVLA